MSSLSRLSSALVPQSSFSLHGNEEVFEVSQTAQAAAAVYEKLRNTIDYQDEHLLRRNAILRILKRYTGQGVALSAFASELLKELVWAKYLPNKGVPTAFAERLAAVMQKYTPLLAAAQAQKRKGGDTYAWVLDMLASEIDDTIVPTTHVEALTAFMYDELKRRMDWDPGFVLDDKEKDLRFFVAVHRALLKSNPATLRYRLFTLYYPQWQSGEMPIDRIEDIARNLPTVVKTIEHDIHHPLTDKIARLLRRKAGIFRVLGDVLSPAVAQKDHHDHHTTEKGSTEHVDLSQDPERLDTAVIQALNVRVKDFRTRLRRTVVRAVIFLFLTKMLLALLLEVPYDYFLLGGEVQAVPLLVNIFFPPVLLAIVGLTISIQEQKNSKDYVAAVRAIAVGADHPVLHVRVKKPSESSWNTVFGALYALLFILVYGCIGVALHSFGFHALSIGLFLFFLSLVTFFGIRIRMSVRDVVAADGRTGIMGSFFDLVSLPIVKAGAWLSTKVAKINVFIYFFDFIVEAPLKVAIEFIESWLTFVKEKKEEI